MTGNGGGQAWAPDGPELVAETRHVSGAAVVTVQGELDALTTPRVRAAIQDSLIDAEALLVIDLTELTFLGSSGLAVLLEFQERAAERGVGFYVVVGDNRYATRPIEITGLTAVLPLRRHLGDALHDHNAPIGEDGRPTEAPQPSRSD